MAFGLSVEKVGLFAQQMSSKNKTKAPSVLVLVEGEILVEHQTCGSCRPKTTGLSKLGTYLELEESVFYRVRNNTMLRAEYLVITTSE